MIITKYSKLQFINGTYDVEKTIHTNKRRKSTVIIACDEGECSSVWEEWFDRTLVKAKKRVEQLCPACLSRLVKYESGVGGTIALKSISEADRKINAASAGRLSQKTGKPSRTWFSTERWNELSSEQQRIQVLTANKAAMDRLNSLSDDDKAKHYAKIFKGSCMGFVSRGHLDLHDHIQLLGFQSNVQISKCNVDECNEDLKIIVEYNGDAYHCNPRMYTSEYYSNLIKMYAWEKWQKDRNRYMFLRKLGYIVVVVWESDWISNKSRIVESIKNICNRRILENATIEN